MITDNVTPEQALETLDHVVDDAACDVERVTTIERYIDQSAARIAELQSLTTWRPIGTAPRDGTRVLVWDAASPKPVVAFYGSARGARRWMGASIPTHWLPLPAAPVETKP